MKLYGLKNCDTCRKALKWLQAHDLTVEFVDVRGDGMTRDDFERFITHAGHDTALNRKSATWRSLSPDEKADIDDSRAVELAAHYPALLKRPVIEVDGEIIIGFDAAAQARLAQLAEKT